MSCYLKRLNRCECHEISFEEILRYARLLGIVDLDSLIQKLGFCQTCTACHCDVRELLAEQSREIAESETVPVVFPDPFARIP